MIKLIVGLGNPSGYAQTRHNVGKQLLDFLAESLFSIAKNSPGWTANYESVVLYKPNCYMNVSGPPVKAMMTALSVAPSELLLVADNLDTAFGKLKVKVGGSHEGHRGVESVLNSLRTKDVRRLYIGIGRPASKDDVVEYVLENFTKSQG
mmetsp:Transcript_20796/g.38640  ORF Transcript_20796/g.38640 Transcript_20796/m.38640 type:complete len:150 (-) Transcript_20796:724-1173(-)